MNRTRLIISVLFGGLIGCSFGSAAGETNQWEIQRDIQYAEVGDLSLKLDLYIPHGKVREPLIVWVRGGAWRSDRRKACL
jgi:hypothetical protein